MDTTKGTCETNMSEPLSGYIRTRKRTHVTPRECAPTCENENIHTSNSTHTHTYKHSLIHTSNNTHTHTGPMHKCNHSERAEVLAQGECVVCVWRRFGG